MLTEKQRAERKKGIGGSDAAAICGMSKWRTPLDVYLEKLGLIESDNKDHLEFIYWGNRLENIIAEEYARRTQCKIKRLNKMIKHPKYPWMLANVDRLIVGKNAVLECKTAGQFTSQNWGEDYTDEFPDEYLLQCAHYRVVLDANYVDLSVLIGGQRLGIYKYKRNNNLEKNLIEKEHDFWHNNILKEIAPDPILSSDANKRWATSNGEIIHADPEIKLTIDTLKSLKAKISQLEETKEKLELEIKNKLQNAEGLKDEFGNLLLSWKNQTVNRFDLSKFKTEHPETYTKYLKESNNRMFKLRGRIA
jgi:putative phage-type endonuclease